MAANYADDEVIAGYGLSHEEWEAAKRYYADHIVFIDARIITNTQAEADDDVPPMRPAEEHFAWLHREDHSPATTRTEPSANNG